MKNVPKKDIQSAIKTTKDTKTKDKQALDAIIKGEEEDIEKPKEFDREAWLQRISMFHWKLSELNDGTCWRHMRQFVQ